MLKCWNVTFENCLELSTSSGEWWGRHWELKNQKLLGLRLVATQKRIKFALRYAKEVGKSWKLEGSGPGQFLQHKKKFKCWNANWAKMLRLKIAEISKIGKGTKTGGPKGWKFHHRMAWCLEMLECLRGLGPNIKKSKMLLEKCCARKLVPWGLLKNFFVCLKGSGIGRKLTEIVNAWEQYLKNQIWKK